MLREAAVEYVKGTSWDTRSVVAVLVVGIWYLVVNDNYPAAGLGFTTLIFFLVTDIQRGLLDEVIEIAHEQGEMLRKRGL